MYKLDKENFGAFVAALRKEKGYTQKISITIDNKYYCIVY